MPEGHFSVSMIYKKVLIGYMIFFFFLVNPVYKCIIRNLTIIARIKQLMVYCIIFQTGVASVWSYRVVNSLSDCHECSLKAFSDCFSNSCQSHLTRISLFCGAQNESQWDQMLFWTIFIVWTKKS